MPRLLAQPRNDGRAVNTALSVIASEARQSRNPSSSQCLSMS
ncbi:MAG: hypothetical protein WCG04_05080 [Alphaproteobacteria bacterium]